MAKIPQHVTRIDVWYEIGYDGTIGIESDEWGEKFYSHASAEHLQWAGKDVQDAEHRGEFRVWPWGNTKGVGWTAVRI